MKILKKEKKKPWRYGGEGAKHKIWTSSMQQFPRDLNLRTTDGRTDACAMTVGLLTKSSRANKKHYWEKGNQTPITNI